VERLGLGVAALGTVELDVSTLADWVGASAATLMPLVETIRAHVFAAERIHPDDTTVPVLAKGKARTGRLWVYVRDDQPFAGHEPPAAAFFYSPDRGGEHPERHLANCAGPMQADAYAGFNRFYEGSRKPAPIIGAACWAHARRKFFDLARLKQAPIASSISAAFTGCVRCMSHGCRRPASETLHNRVDSAVSGTRPVRE
jgi:transposase